MDYKSLVMMLALGVLGWSESGKSQDSLETKVKEIQNLPSDIRSIYQYAYKAAGSQNEEVANLIEKSTDKLCSEQNSKGCLIGRYVSATIAFFRQDRSKEIILFNQILNDPALRADSAYPQIEETIKKTFHDYKMTLSQGIKPLPVNEEARKIIENYNN